MSKTARTLLLLGIILSTVGCDRITKHLASAHLTGQLVDHAYLNGLLRLEYAENTGGFLSLGAALPAGLRNSIFIFGATVVLCVIAVMVWTCRLNTATAGGLSLVLAGGSSNLFDRVVHGGVIDFLNVGLGPVRTGIFNIADVAICTGLLLIAFTSIRFTKGQV
jgi:signal peptidase II